MDAVRVRIETCGTAQDIGVHGHLVLAGDATPLQQVVLHLLSNAMDALSNAQAPHSRIGIMCFVEDGPGIDPSQEADLFALFKTSKSRGLCVGLWLSQAIVQSHGGLLDFQSIPGQGAVFSMRLPIHTYALVH